MTPSVEGLLFRIRDRGYASFSVNLWRERRLYINIKGETDLFFDLDEIEGSFCLHSRKQIPSPLFGDMFSLRNYICQNREALIASLKDAGTCTVKPDTVLSDPFSTDSVIAGFLDRVRDLGFGEGKLAMYNKVFLYLTVNGRTFWYRPGRDPEFVRSTRQCGGLYHALFSLRSYVRNHWTELAEAMEPGVSYYGGPDAGKRHRAASDKGKEGYAWLRWKKRRV